MNEEGGREGGEAKVINEGVEEEGLEEAGKEEGKEGICGVE